MSKINDIMLEQVAHKAIMSRIGGEVPLIELELQISEIDDIHAMSMIDLWLEDFLWKR